MSAAMQYAGSATGAEAPALRLVSPSLGLLPQYEAALAAGWSPDTERDVSGEQLRWVRRDPRGFLAELIRQRGKILTAEGAVVPRLPSRVFWIDDGEFCGISNLRFARGTDALPSHVSGHIGYAVVPWKRRRGYATQALALLLPVAREVGLRRVEVTCDDDNEASRRVILKNGGVPAGSRTEAGGRRKLVFHIDLAPLA